MNPRSVGVFVALGAKENRANYLHVTFHSDTRMLAIATQADPQSPTALSRRYSSRPLSDVSEFVECRCCVQFSTLTILYCHLWRLEWLDGLQPQSNAAVTKYEAMNFIRRGAATRHSSTSSFALRS